MFYHVSSMKGIVFLKAIDIEGRSRSDIYTLCFKTIYLYRERSQAIHIEEDLYCVINRVYNYDIYFLNKI